MKLENYAIWICTRCHGKFCVMRPPRYCPYCRATTRLGCGGNVVIDFSFGRKMQMKIDLPVGTRATLEEFIDAYTPYFLMKYGYREYSTPVPLSGRRVICRSVKTKHGEIIVHDDDVLTYVGSKKWAVEQRKEQKDGIAQG